MTEIKIIDGQKVVYNPERKLIKTVIDTPFMSAGKKLSWDLSKYGCAGIGLNERIIELVLKTNSTLIVYVLSTPNGPVDKDYWITSAMINNFISYNSTHYKIRDVNLLVIPWNLFTTHIEHITA